MELKFDLKVIAGGSRALFTSITASIWVEEDPSLLTFEKLLRPTMKQVEP